MSLAKPKLPIYVSMKACSGETKCPMELLTAARQSTSSSAIFGANNSVALLPLLHWIFTRDEGDGDESGIEWPKELAKFKAKREEIRLFQDRGEMVKRGEVQDAVTNGMATLVGDLRRILCTELPPVLKGLDELSIQRIIDREIDRLIASLRVRFATLGEPKKEKEKPEETK